jgi:hypothetical protein
MQDATSHDQTSEGRFELVIRLQQPRTSSSSDSGARLRAQGLIEDLLMSRLQVGTEMHAHEYVHAQGFAELGKALAASRALQVALEGFRTAFPAGRPYVSVLLDSSPADETTAAPARPSIEQKDLLRLAKPSQVLLTQAFYNQIAPYQAALRSSPLRAGLYEFLWTSEQRLEALQAEAEFMPTLPILVEPAQPAALADTVIARPVTRREPDPRPAVLADTMIARPVTRRDPAPQPAPEPDPDTAESRPRKWLSAQRVAAVSSLAAILLVVGYLVTSRGLIGNHSKPAAPSPGQVDQPTPAPPTPAPPPTPPTGGTPAADSAKVEPTPKKPRKVVDVAPGAFPSPAPDSSKPVSKARGCSIDVGEIPDYLKLAEKYSSRGNYERAMTEYSAVLGCQPGNRQALDGLRNAKAAEDLGSR